MTQRGVVAVDGLDQSEGGDLHEILEFLPMVPEAARDTVGHRQQLTDDVVPEGRLSWPRELLRELAHQRVELLRARPFSGRASPDRVGG
ncbi:hypothetical protein [Streptomyces sp. 11x1]|uniref:hypothetical protein n=1 Tax=Streptomyces sp. 11x1 TaxID=3038642 RepID=UPI002931CF08|nr:hypothetical protein [Streptomyces sp. 11x1]WNZ08081.1 hypothetical protein P8T65_11105 [Streptomyces sp. 11x1]